MDDIARAANLLQDAKRVVVLTGAGVSTESGVPDFRSPEGIWSRFDPRDFEYDRFLRDPRGFWELRTKLMEALDLDAARPNPAHEAIAAASHSPRFLGHVTQNIDGLFHVAGHAADKLVEVHGSGRTVRCLSCSRFFPYETARARVEQGIVPPPCPSCAGPLKPGTILFGEALHKPDLDQAALWARRCDAMLVAGSSLTVHPAAALPMAAVDAGAALVLVNDAPTPYDGHADALVRRRCGDALPRLLARSGLPR